MTQQQTLTSETLEGTVHTIRYQGDDGWSVAQLDSGETLVGTMPGLRKGLEVQVRGEWGEHPDYGEQFQVDTFEQHTPTSEDGIASWLEAQVDGIGLVRARRIAQSLDVEGEPTADEIRGCDADVRDELLERAASAWSDDVERRSALVTLQGLGLTSLQAKKAWKKWATRAPEIVESDPYRLVELTQIGFQTADGIARGMGVGRDDDVRLRAGILYALNQATDDGHVGLPKKELTAEAADALDVRDEAVYPHIGWILERDRLVAERGLLFEPTLARDERRVASRLQAIDAATDTNGHDEGARPDRYAALLTDEQRDAFEAAWSGGGVVTLTGGPGTGKTYTLKAIVEAWRTTDESVHLAAPTGRAAKRIEEAVGESASTIHRLLDFRPGTGFTLEPKSLDGLVVIDETSMLDTHLAARLFERIADETTVLLVGDPDQLPSVGPGYVLQDILDSTIGQSAHLTKVHRQAEGSGIVEIAYHINDGRIPDLDRESYDDLGLVRVDGSAHAQAAVQATVDRLEEKGFKLADDIQVLAPMYSSEAGVDALNETLQKMAHDPDALASGEEHGSDRFVVGDRVMQTRNNYDLGVFNGDVGRIVEMGDLSPTMGERMVYDDENPSIAVRVEYPDGREVGYTGYLAAAELTLSYACTTHKAQGSEYPAAVVVLTASHWIMCERTLLYTAITRAKDFGVLIAEPRALKRAVQHHSPVDRHRALHKRLAHLNDTDGGHHATR
ncbi:MAG: AAA family ATPase [Bradymonadaceae bacterium]